MNEDFLQNLKPGDEVAVAQSGWKEHYYSFERVERVTKLHILVGRKKFKLKSGHEVGSYRNGAWLVGATAELKAEVAARKRRNILVNKIESVKWEQVETSILEQIDALLQTPKDADASQSTGASAPL